MTSSADALSAAPVLAYVERSGFVESVHRALAVVVDPDGSVVEAHGPVDAPFFPRSSNKPLQALAMVRSGLRLEPRLLALAAASHSGEDFHLSGVRQILAGAGLTEDDLQNTPDFPYDDQARVAWIRAGHDKASIAQNCSGKHAGMVATCVAAGWPTRTYLDPEHPLQLAAAQALADLTGEPVSATGVDGCGAPVMAVTPRGLAHAFGRLAAAPAGSPEGEIRDAIRAHPHYLGGTRRDVTALIRGVDGLIAKDGAEAVYAIGLADGRGLVVKVADGGQRARPVIAAAMLRRMGVDGPAIEELANAPVLGHGQPVGSVHTVGL